MRQRSKFGRAIVAGANAWNSNINYTVGTTPTVYLPLIAIPEGILVPVSIGNILVRTIHGHVDFSLAPQSSNNVIEHTLNFSCGIYKAQWDPVMGDWEHLDPSKGTDVGNDNWLSVDGMTFGMFQRTPLTLGGNMEYQSRYVHDVSSDIDVVIARGQCLMLAINLNQWGSNNSFYVDVCPWVRIFYDLDE